MSDWSKWCKSRVLKHSWSERHITTTDNNQQSGINVTPGRKASLHFIILNSQQSVPCHSWFAEVGHRMSILVLNKFTPSLIRPVFCLNLNFNATYWVSHSKTPIFYIHINCRLLPYHLLIIYKEQTKCGYQQNPLKRKKWIFNLFSTILYTCWTIHNILHWLQWMQTLNMSVADPAMGGPGGHPPPLTKT